MPDDGSLICFGIFFLIAIGIEIFVVSEQKNSIRITLKRQDAKDIKISYSLFDSRNGNTYLVEYEDAEGKKRWRICKMHFFDSSIYWEEES